MLNWNAEFLSGACCAIAGDSTTKRMRMEMDVLFMFIVIFRQNYPEAPTSENNSRQDAQNRGQNVTIGGRIGKGIGEYCT